MLDVFRNQKKFIVLFFVALFLDVIVKDSNYPVWPYHYISQSPIILFLILYYYYNNTELKRRNFLWTILSLLCFFIADILLIGDRSIYVLGISILLYTLAKLFFSIRFSHENDFNVGRLIPFSVFMFIYTVALVTYVYEEIGIFFLPMIISYFVSLLLCQFAYLRKEAVDEKSYFFVLIGVVCYMVSEGVMVIKTIKGVEIPYQSLIIMYLYSIGLYFIVHGIVIERKKPSVQ